MALSQYGSAKHHSALFFLLFVVFAGFVGAVILVSSRGGTDTRSQASNEQQYYFKIDPATAPKPAPQGVGGRMPIDPITGANGRPNGVNQYDVDFFGSNGKTSALVSRFNLTIALPDAYKQ